jgi:hypothetical protein
MKARNCCKKVLKKVSGLREFPAKGFKWEKSV